MDNMNNGNMEFTNEPQSVESNIYAASPDGEAGAAEPDEYERERRNGHINIQSVPVKKHRLRKAAPIIASTLVSALIGGVIGGVYVNNLAEQKNYETPVTISQNKTGSVNQISYTPPSGLIAKVASEVGPAIVGVDIQVVADSFFGQKKVGQGSGSGIIFDKRGYIITNQHVIDGAGANGITVTLAGGKKYPAQVIGQDNISDIAILKIKRIIMILAFSNSASVRVAPNILSILIYNTAPITTVNIPIMQ
jgi:serine protease Do